jgi:VCBS repeat-containing protein
VTYTPNTNFNGGDRFTFRVNDGTTNSSLATVSITVTPVNDAPVANNDAYTTLGNVPLIVPPPAGILTNDVDVDGDALTAVLVSDTAHGSLSLSTNGGFTYTPNTNYFGSDSFTYRATDGLATGNVATVTITILDNTPLRFSSAEMTADGFAFQLSMPAGRTYVILASTNNQDWTPISTNVALTASVVFTDTTATNYSMRFYRAMVQ